MRVIDRVDELRRALADRRARGERVGFVPTMGFLHEGHLRLVDVARERSDVVVMSIFVNPLQFGPKEDFTRYPRDFAGDRAKAESHGVEFLFVPSAAEMHVAAKTPASGIPASCRIAGFTTTM